MEKNKNYYYCVGKFLAVMIMLLISTGLWAATVDTIYIYSASMKKTRKCVVIKPEGYEKKSSSYPSIYLLHGHSGDYSNWINKVPALKEQADLHQVLIICPDGENSSWYINSPVDSSMQYETYIVHEVVDMVDKNYRTIKNKRARAITGLSMGGHGAFYLAFNHPEIFGACGSMSGGMDLMASRQKYDLMKRIGDTTQVEKFKEYSILYRVENKPSPSLKIIFDCGLKDPFYPANKALHEKMLALEIEHDFITRPGSHNWTYWADAVPYHILFFKRFFDQYPGR
jgi:S-formylglutathione hydrolase FrmB